MNLIRCLHITNANEAIQQIKKVGVDPAGIKLMEGKILHFNLKIEGIEPRTANLLKQEMLSLGGDVADGRGLIAVPNRQMLSSWGHKNIFRN
jgi:dihydropteroate synthase